MAVDKIHKKQRFFYWAEWGEERTAGILQMTFLKKGIYKKRQQTVNFFVFCCIMQITEKLRPSNRR